MVYIDLLKYRDFMVSSLLVEAFVVFAIVVLLKKKAGKRKVSPQKKRLPSSVSIGRNKEGKRFLNFKSLRFVGDASALIPGQESVLDEIAETILSPDFSGRNFRIIGHTCYTGRLCDEEFSKKLSLERAETIASELFRRNVPKKRVSCVGKGYSEPLVENPVTNEQAAMNRRVEIVVDE